MSLRPFLLPLAGLLLAFFAAGCAKTAAPAVAGAPHKHHHHTPHGGVPIELGAEEYHVELVFDEGSGKLQAYILDDEMENFVRSANPSITLAAVVKGAQREAVLGAVPNPETGETVGDTALFEAQADWMKGAGSFDGVLKTITIHDSTYADVKFNYPKGNDDERWAGPKAP